MSEPTTAAGRALLEYLDVAARETYFPFDGIRPGILAIEAEARAPLAAIVALARAREAASVAVEEQPPAGSIAAGPWYAERKRLLAEQAAAVAALRSALGEVAG